MTQQEHLNRIRARCVELLEIAEKRTAEVWHVSTNPGPMVFGYKGEQIADTRGDFDYRGGAMPAKQDGVNNATFIASCAGAAEAGWRATIAAIDGFLAYEQSVLTPQVEREYASMQLTAIIASWPEDLL